MSFFSSHQFWVEIFKKENIDFGYSLNVLRNNLMVKYFQNKNKYNYQWNEHYCIRYKFNIFPDDYKHSGKLNRKFHKTYREYILNFLGNNKRLLTTFACHNPYFRKISHKLCDITNLSHKKKY